MLTAFTVWFVILKIGGAFVGGAPVEVSSAVRSDISDFTGNGTEDGEIYDQRQNGTENYRINVKGVVVLVAPAETVLQAAQLPDMEGEVEASTSGSQMVKPKPRPPSPGNKVPAGDNDNKFTSDPSKERNFKLFNLLRMFNDMNHEGGRSMKIYQR